MKKTLVYIILAHVLLIGCQRESDFPLTAPSIITSHQGPPQITQEPGQAVYLDFTLQAASGLQYFEVLKDGEVYFDKTFSEGEITYNYEFNYQIESSTALGAENEFVFRVYDSDNREASYTYSIHVFSTFSETQEEIAGRQVTRLKGRSNNDYQMQADRVYLIDSTFSIENNSTLSIPQGSTVYFKTYDNSNVVSRLMISRGSRIVANGTANEPIVFTSDKLLLNETPGTQDWGGIYIFGNAPTNEGDNIYDAGFLYGGNIPNDSSGNLSYVRVEYAGKNDSHALNLFGVGGNTQIDHVQVYRNENIAFRINGGRVNLKYIAAIGHGGYGIWAEHGWQGNGQFWLFQTDVAATLVPRNFWNQARSIEMRNDENNFLNSPRTAFNISNVTLIGNGFEDGQDNGTRRGVRIRRGAYGVLQNMIVTQFPNDGVRVEDLDVSELGEVMILDNTKSFNNQTNYEQDAAAFFYRNPDFNVTSDGVAGISTSNYVGSIASDFNPIILGNWFSSAPYIGAVENQANNWTTQGNWFRTLEQ